MKKEVGRDLKRGETTLKYSVRKDSMSNQLRVHVSLGLAYSRLRGNSYATNKGGHQQHQTMLANSHFRARGLDHNKDLTSRLRLIIDRALMNV
jgi:hypothetical protein